MKTIEEFSKCVSKEVMTCLPESLTKKLNCKPVTITKINDTEHHAISFETELEAPAPLFYVEDLYEQYLEEKDIQPAALELAHRYLTSLLNPMPANTPSADFDIPALKDHLALRLVDMRRNIKYLKERPYISPGFDLAIVCDVHLDDGYEGCWRTAVQRGTFEDEMTEEELFSNAFKNVRKIDPPVLNPIHRDTESIAETINLLDPDTEVTVTKPVTFYVLTNKYKHFGAAALFYPGVQEEIAMKLGEGYYAIPSSLNEFIILPESTCRDWHDLQEMVKDSNENIVPPTEVLTDKILYYDCQREDLVEMTDSDEAQRICS